MPLRKYVGGLDGVEVALPSGLRVEFTRDEAKEVLDGDAEALDRHPDFVDPDNPPDPDLQALLEEEAALEALADRAPAGPPIPPAPEPPVAPDPRVPDTTDHTAAEDFDGPPHEEA